jgi:hypothetical protein
VAPSLALGKYKRSRASPHHQRSPVITPSGKALSKGRCTQRRARSTPRRSPSARPSPNRPTRPEGAPRACSEAATRAPGVRQESSKSLTDRVICRYSPFAMADNVGVNRQLNRQQFGNAVRVVGDRRLLDSASLNCAYDMARRASPSDLRNEDSLGSSRGQRDASSAALSPASTSASGPSAQ